MPVLKVREEDEDEDDDGDQEEEGIVQACPG